MNRQLTLIALVAATCAYVTARAAFPPPVQADPASQYTAAIGIDYQNVLSYTRTLNYDPSFNPYPGLY